VFNIILAEYGRGDFSQLFLHDLHSLLNAPPHIHGIHAGSNGFQAFLEHETSQNGGRCGAIASFVVCLLGNLLDKAGPNVVVPVTELNVLGHSDAVFGDLWSSERFIENDISTPGSQRDRYSISKQVCPLKHELPGLNPKLDVFSKFSHGHIAHLHRLVMVLHVPRKVKASLESL